MEVRRKVQFIQQPGHFIQVNGPQVFSLSVQQDLADVPPSLERVVQVHRIGAPDNVPGG
jgi:hypothetical protein